MANSSQIKLEIVTALNNAGIKATKAQIDDLQNSITKFNKAETNSLTKLPGKLGNVIGKLGSFGKALGAVGLAVEAFKEGWKIGTWINDNIVTPLFGIKDANEELIKSNKRSAEAHRKTMEVLDLKHEAIGQNAKDEIDAIDTEIRKNEELRKSYLKVAQAKNEMLNLGKDAEIQRLERERFEDILQLEDAGDTEGAKQANALYDFYRKQIEAKKEIEQYDRETEDLLERQTLELQKQEAARDKARAKGSEIQRYRRAIDELGQTATSAHEYNRGERKLLRKIKNAQKELAILETQETSLSELEDVHAQEMENRRIGRAILMDKMMSGIDYTASAYDKAVSETNNALGIRFDRTYIDELADNSKNSYNVLKSIDEGIRNVSENIVNPWRMR